MTASQEVTGVLALGSAVLAAMAGYFLYRSRRSSRRRTVGKVSKLIIYPIKSGPGLVVNSAECTETGLKYKQIYDRRFVFVGNNEFISIRKNLKLLNLLLTYDEVENCLVLTAPGMETDLRVPLEVPEYDPARVKSFMWYDKRETFYLDIGTQYSDWLTEYLGQPCALGYSHPNLKREINPEMTYNQTTLHADTKIMYPNSHPYLVVSQCSLEDLNSRLDEQVTMDSFRPNVIVADGDDNYQLSPYEEDSWRDLYFGDEAYLYSARACPRCPMIYINYQKQELRPNKEPMTTLLKYRRGTERKDRSKTVFGINASLVTRGKVAVGDTVAVTAAES